MAEKVETLVLLVYNIFEFLSDERYIWKKKQIDLKI